MSAILEVSDLIKRYGTLTAVDGLSFSVQPGQCFGLLGPNGAGKTTTMEMLEGIVQPDGGEIRYFGQAATAQHFKSLGIQFQQTALQDFLTTHETLKLFASFYPEPADMSKLIELCELTEFLHQDHRKLSGGQRQRLLLALALINQPKILFLDEPTTGLDPHARRNFWALIQAIKAKGCTVILTTHYMDEAEMLCDDIVIVDHGKIIAQGSPKALLAEHFTGSELHLPYRGQLPQIEATMRVQGDFFVISSQDTEHTIRRLLAVNWPLTGLYVKSANLDDLFLKLTGHSLQGASA